MRDFLKKYHKKKTISNLGIVAVSLVLAAGINIFLIDGTTTGNNLKASILNSGNSVNNYGDLYLSQEGNKILVKSGTSMNDVENISYTITFNPSDVEINSIESDIGDIINITSEPGVNSVIVSISDVMDLEKNSNIGYISFRKKTEKIAQLNILNANFKDSKGDSYSLSTSGINF